MARLNLFCLIHPKQDVRHMEEIDRIVKGLGWLEADTYAIVIDSLGYYIGCEWSGEKQSPDAAVAELTARGVLPNEYLICAREEADAVRLKRRAEGYFDDIDFHA
jgi:hypothetical protein